MSRSQLYQEAKLLAKELGINDIILRNQWKKSTTELWDKQVKVYKKDIKNRNKNYNVALRVSREYKEPLTIPNMLKGTNNEEWKKQIRRIRMRARRGKAQVQKVPPTNQLLTQIREIKEPIIFRQQRRTRKIAKELEALILNKRIKKLIFSNNIVGFQEILNIVAIEKKIITRKQAISFYEAVIQKGRYIFKMRFDHMLEKIITINNLTREFIILILTKGFLDQIIAPEWGSDKMDSAIISSIISLEIEKVIPRRIIGNRDGDFFPYTNTTNLNLTEYQIYNQTEAYDINTISKREQCLLFSLKKCGISETIINEIKLSYVCGAHIRKTDIKNIADLIHRDISINSMNGKKISKIIHKAKVKEEDSKTIEIAIHSNHYFIFEETIYSKFSIDNYAELENIEEKHRIVKIRTIKDKKYYDKADDRKINSLLLIDKLYNANYFKKLDLVNFDETNSHIELKNHIFLDNIDNEQREMKTGDNAKKTKPQELIYYADCESYVSGVAYHQLQLIGVVSDTDDYVSIFNVCDERYRNNYDCEDNFDVGDESYSINQVSKPVSKPVLGVVSDEDDSEDVFNRIGETYKIKEVSKLLEVSKLSKLSKPVLEVASDDDDDEDVFNRIGETYKIKEVSKLSKLSKPVLEVASDEDDDENIFNMIGAEYKIKEISKELLKELSELSKLPKLPKLLEVKSGDKPVLSVVSDEINQNKVSKEQLIVYDFLKLVTGNGKHNALVYYHNVKYDLGLLEKFLNVKDRCEKDGQVYSVICKYKGQTVELRDSYKILPFALNKFGKEFELEKEYRKKEAIGYNYYKPENNNKIITIKEYAVFLSDKDEVIFKEEVKKCESYNSVDMTFNPMTYYKEYLKLDCLVLKKGIQKFNALIKEITNNKMDVYKSLTISSLTDSYMIKEGAYDGVYEIKGNLRAYVAKAVYGGRVCCNETKDENNNYLYKKKVLEGKYSDYDGVSLYPSAINRLCRLKGLAIGKATRFNKDEFDTWKDKHYSIMTVKILKVNKTQQMPFIAYKDEKAGSITYMNEPPPEDVIIDSITLEDYIKFHEIEYTISEGVYWDAGGNNRMGEVINSLFNVRLKYKKTNKALANTIKLMLNSAYGKTITKKTTSEKKILKTTSKRYNKDTKMWEKSEKTDFESYLYNNFNTIKSFRTINSTTKEIERVKADNSYNRGHIGSAILSTSKTIMNEIFDISNSNGFVLYYSDTDSIHLNYDDVKPLEDKYREKYNRELNGKQLEQFHTDFDLLDEDDEPRNGETEEIYAIKSVFLGKKTYMDYLQSKDKKGNIINGYHLRMKGITKEGLEEASKDYITKTDKDGYIGLYTYLCGKDKNGDANKKNIILNPYNCETNKMKVLFEFKDGKVRTRNEFTRKVSF